MDSSQLALIAGSISTLIFAASNIPMLLKVWKTKDMRSYSPINIVLANLGNLVHWVYIIDLPFGPVWLLHGYYTVTTALMLGLYVIYRRRQQRQIRQPRIRGHNAAIFQTQEMYAV
jgi:uncharacterized protein with PQ loop repeat